MLNNGMNGTGEFGDISSLDGYTSNPALDNAKLKADMKKKQTGDQIYQSGVQEGRQSGYQEGMQDATTKLKAAGVNKMVAERIQNGDIDDRFVTDVMNSGLVDPSLKQQLAQMLGGQPGGQPDMQQGMPQGPAPMGLQNYG